MQVAPYNAKYQFDDDSDATTIFDSSQTSFNTYQGGTLQQAVSAITFINDSVYNDQEYGVYGYEWYSNPSKRDDGFITWYSSGEEAWKVTAASLGPDSQTEISQRIIPEEPMVRMCFLQYDVSLMPVQYVIINFGMSRKSRNMQNSVAMADHSCIASFQTQDWMHLQFPAKMYVDYVRVYQRPDISDGATCDPPNYPTADYISRYVLCLRCVCQALTIRIQP